MKLQQKATASFTKAIEDRTVTGIFAVHGHIDDGNDRSWPGSFVTEVNGRSRVRFLWQHNSMEPPIAAINYIREVPRADLPAAVLAYAPDATGGVEVSRTYLTDSFSDRVLQGIKAGAISEMSYAYEPVKFDFEEIEGRGQIRNLRQMHIFDASDVAWGMNNATSADGLKGLDWKDRPLIDHIVAVEAYYGDMDELLEQLHALKDRRSKEGRVLALRIRDRLGAHPPRLRAVADDIDTLLRETAPDPEPEKASAAAVRAARWEWQQRRLALLNLGA